MRRKPIKYLNNTTNNNKSTNNNEAKRNNFSVTVALSIYRHHRHYRTASMAESVYVTVVVEVAPANQAQWLGIVADLVRETRREKGCLKYVFTRNTKKENRFVITEHWASAACLQAHTQTRHFKDLVPKMGALGTVCCPECMDLSIGCCSVHQLDLDDHELSRC